MVGSFRKQFFMTYNGILNLNKPTGMTSRRVVDLVQRLSGRIRSAMRAHSIRWPAACLWFASGLPRG